jgi:hypothetical protein
MGSKSVVIDVVLITVICLDQDTNNGKKRKIGRNLLKPQIEILLGKQAFWE